MVNSESPRRIALIVTTYNRPDTLVRVLASYSTQTNRAFDVTVTDDGLRNDTRSAIEAAAKTALYPLRHAWHPDDSFRADEICNRNVLVTDVDYPVFLDGDCMPRPDFVAWHHVLAERGRLLPDSCILLNEAMTREVIAQQTDIHLKDRAYWFAAWCTGCVNKFVPLLVPGLPMSRTLKGTSLHGIRSCDFGVRCNDSRRVNGLDQSFVGWGREDTNLTVRLYNVDVQCKRNFCATEVLHL